MTNRKIYYIDVGSIPPNQMEGYIRGIKDVLQKMSDDETLKKEMKIDPRFKIEGMDD